MDALVGSLDALFLLEGDGWRAGDRRSRFVFGWEKTKKNCPLTGSEESRTLPGPFMFNYKDRPGIDFSAPFFESICGMSH